MNYVNQQWFDRHDALPMARGASSKSAIYSSSGDVVGYVTNGGIALPMRHILPAGARIVRFGTILPWVAVTGGWWLEQTAYDRIKAWADSKGHSVQVGVRLCCCVPLDWSTMDVVVHARLKQPLLAYRGVGSPAVVKHHKTGTSERIDPQSDLNGVPVEQLFIPGIGNPDVRHDSLMVERTGNLPQEDARRGYIIRPA